MNILMIDTSGPACGVAVSRDGQIVCELQLTSGRTHSQRVMPMVDQALALCEMAVADIDLFGAVVGPGSFTGVRIGVSTVKALAHAAGKPCIGIDALEALAANAPYFDGVICPILDARRSQVYCAAFRFAAGELPERILPDDALPLTEFIARLPQHEKCLFLGDGLNVHFPAIRALMGDRAIAAPAPMAFIRPAAACYLAEKRQDEAVEPMLLKPLYLRAPQAERERSARLRLEKET